MVAPVSDTFDGDLSLWTQYDPVGDCSFGISSGEATITTPAGTTHDAWTNNKNAPRLEQATDDVDIDCYVEMTVAPTSSGNNDGGGIMVSTADRNTFVRLDYNRKSTGWYLFAANINGASSTTRFNITGTLAIPLLLRITRTKATDAWLLRYSTDDGATWTTPAGGSFTLAMTAAKVAIHAENAVNNPAATQHYGRFTNLLASSTTTVGTSVAMRWNVGGPVAAAAALVWDVAANLGDVVTTFDGATLPTGWTFSDPDGGSSYTMVGDRLRITVPQGITRDSIYESSGTSHTDDHAVGVLVAMSDQDFDLAIELGTDVHSLQGLGVYFFPVGAGTDRIRAGWYSKNVASAHAGDDFEIIDFCAAAESGTVTNAAGTNSVIDTWFGGSPAWMRLTRAGTDWTLHGSADGVNWTQIRAFTASIALQGLKIGVTRTGTTDALDFNVDMFRVVDLNATPDPRPDVVNTQQANVQATDFSAGIPSWLDTSTGPTSGTAALTGSPQRLRLTTDSAQSQSWGAVGYNGTPSTDQGLLLKYEFVATAAGHTPFLTPGVVGHGSDADMYNPFGGTGYDLELNPVDNVHREVRRVDRVDTMGPDPDGFENGYTHLSGETQTDADNTGVWWVRIEYVNGRYRSRQWQDGDAEPSTWRFDGADRVAAGAGVQWVSWSHNDPGAGGAAAPSTVDIFHFERYDLVAAGTTAVRADAGLLWGAREAVTSAASIEWTTLADVAASLDTRWEARKPAAAAAALAWDVGRATRADATAAWTTRRLVNTASAFAWAVRDVAGSPLDLRWNLRNRVAATQSVRWRIAANATTAAAIEWRIHQLAASAAALRWDVQRTGSVNTDLDARWNTRQVAGGALTAVWTVDGSVAAQLNAAWSVRRDARADLALAWDVAGATGVVRASCQLRWTSRGLARAPLASRWNVATMTAAAAALAWAVRETAGQGASIAWAARAHATGAVSVRWRVQTNGSTVAFYYTVSLADRARTARLAEPAYSVRLGEP